MKSNLEYNAVIETLQKAINESNQMWNKKEKSHAYIIGYLEGSIKGVIRSLSDLEKNNSDEKLTILKRNGLLS